MRKKEKKRKEKERKGKERKGKERKGKERKGKERKRNHIMFIGGSVYRRNPTEVAQRLRFTLTTLNLVHTNVTVVTIAISVTSAVVTVLWL